MRDPERPRRRLNRRFHVRSKVSSSGCVLKRRPRCIKICADGDKDDPWLPYADLRQSVSKGEHVDVSLEQGDEDKGNRDTFGILDNEGRSITVAATAPEAPRKVSLSGLKQADVSNTVSARVSATVTIVSYYVYLSFFQEKMYLEQTCSFFSKNSL